MKRSGTGVFALAVILLASAALYVFAIASLKRSIDTAGKELLGPGFDASGIRIMPFGDEFTIRNLTIPNPDGFGPETAVSMSGIGADVVLGSALKDIVQIRDIRIDTVIVHLVRMDGVTNLRVVLDKLEIPEGVPPPRRYAVYRFTVDNVIMSATLPIVGRRFVNAGPIALTDPSGASSAVSARELLQLLLSRIATRFAGQIF